jgi:integrase
VDERTGRERLAPMKAWEVWTDPRTGKVVKAGRNGSTWTWSFTTGTKAAGNRRTHSKGGYATRKAAQAALTEALAAYGRGDTRPLMKPDATPLNEYLCGWLETREGLRTTTRRSYQNVIDAWIRPWVGEVPLRDPGPDDLTHLYQDLRERGGRGGRVRKPAPRSPDGRRVTGDSSWGHATKPLGARSVQLVHTVLRMALADAVEAGKIAYNPADRIPRRQRPKHKPSKRADRYWSPDEARSFLDATRDARLWPLWCLALDSGARRGELSALRWPDLDLDNGVMHVKASRTLTGDQVVEGPTKSGKSRVVDLDPRTVTALRAHKARQARERLAAGAMWTGGTPGESGFVFIDELGEPYRPDRLASAFIDAQEGLGLPRIVFHAARHTSATVALAAGVPIPLVSERLGHSKVSITLDVYGHAIPSHGADAARVIGAAIYGAAVGS